MALVTLACDPAPSQTDWPSPTVGYDGEDSRPPPPDDTAEYDGFTCLDDVSWTVIIVTIWLDTGAESQAAVIYVNSVGRTPFRLGAVNESSSPPWTGEACIDGESTCHLVSEQETTLDVVASTDLVVLSESTYFGRTQYEQTSWVLHDGEGRCSTAVNHATGYRDAGCCAQPLD